MSVQRLALVLLLGALGSGCTGRRGAALERTVGGERRLGTFVSPYSYEQFVRGELAREAGDLERAAEHYELARAGGDDDVLLVARLAQVRDALGQRGLATRLLDEGARLDPRSEAIWTARGRIAERHGELEEAVECYAQAVAVSEGSEEPVLALARVLRASGAEERADGVLERYLASETGGVGAARARLSLAMAQHDGRAAGEAALELVRRSPSHTDEVAAAALEALEGGHPTLAHRLIARLPEGTLPRSVRLRVALAAGERAEAEALLAIGAQQTLEEILEAADAWLALGDPAQAIELAELALARGGGADATLILARARWATLEPGRAARLAARIPPGSSRREEAIELIASALDEAGLPALAAELRQSAPR